MTAEGHQPLAFLARLPPSSTLNPWLAHPQPVPRNATTPRTTYDSSMTRPAPWRCPSSGIHGHASACTSPLRALESHAIQHSSRLARREAFHFPVRNATTSRVAVPDSRVPRPETQGRRAGEQERRATRRLVVCASRMTNGWPGPPAVAIAVPGTGTGCAMSPRVPRIARAA